MLVTRLTKRARKRSLVGRILRGLPPERSTLEDLVDAVAKRRGRSINLLPCAFPASSVSGLWVSRDADDYIAFPEDASATRRVAIVCHELGHMLMNHDETGGRLDLGALLAVIAPDVDSQHAARVLARHGYDSKQEAEAEEVGTRLPAHLRGAVPDWDHAVSQRLR